MSLPGDVEIYQGRSFKVYRGMGSIVAMKSGSSDRYFQDKMQSLCRRALRAACRIREIFPTRYISLWADCAQAWGYCGCRSIAELQEKAQFVRITNAGLKESHPHDIVITKEAPNYSVGI